jgi:hypothetical protein
MFGWTLLAIERFGEHACHRGFAPTRASEQIGMGDTTEANGIAESPGDVPLLDDVIKRLGAPFLRAVTWYPIRLSCNHLYW